MAEQTNSETHVESGHTQQGAETHAGVTHAAEGHGKEEGGNVFTEILGELGDHPGFYVGPVKVSELPVILVDGGLKVFSSPTAMKAEGVYTTKAHGKIVRTSDGGSPALDLSITNLVVFQWIAMLLVLTLFRIAGNKYKKNPYKAPSGLQNLLESGYLYVKNGIVKPNIPIPSVAEKLSPYFISLFFFILTINLIGLLPGGHTATAAIPVTLALSIIAFFVINVTGLIVLGPINFLKHLTGGAPWYMAPIMFIIEVAGMFVKPFALTIRLFANMTAGHIVLFALIGFIMFFKLLIIAPAVTAFSLFIYALELLVCFIQAYVFTLLVVLFVGLWIGDHAHGDEHDTHHA